MHFLLLHASGVMYNICNMLKKEQRLYGGAHGILGATLT